MNASSEKFTTKASSCGFEAWIKIERALVYRRPLAVHRSGVVDDQPDRDGKIGVLKADEASA